MNMEATLQEKAKPTGPQKPVHVPPIFVVGVWRCGATLLYLLLNQHPDIRLFFECDLPVLWPMFRLPWGRKTWVEKWEYWNSSVSRHDLDPVRLAAPVTSLADAFELAGREYAGQEGKKIWGCKSPSYYDRLEFLARQFPGARFIVVWRDPEEICRSAVNAAVSGTSGLWFARPGTIHKSVLASEVLKNQVGKLRRIGASLHEIHYRDLVGDANGTMRGICEFLEVPFDPAVTVLNRADRSAVLKGAHHALARGSDIVASKDRHKPLPPKLTSKIERYRALWKGQNGDGWLLSQRFPDTGAPKPGLWERVKDRLLFIGFHWWDIAPRMVFSMLPISAWQTYRRLKYKDSQWIHRVLTNKPTTLRNDSGAAQTASYLMERKDPNKA
jgi:Sulfotransferase family